MTNHPPPSSTPRHLLYTPPDPAATPPSLRPSKSSPTTDAPSTTSPPPHHSISLHGQNHRHTTSPSSSPTVAATTIDITTPPSTSPSLRHNNLSTITNLTPVTSPRRPQHLLTTSSPHHLLTTTAIIIIQTPPPRRRSTSPKSPPSQPPCTTAVAAAAIVAATTTSVSGYPPQPAAASSSSLQDQIYSSFVMNKKEYEEHLKAILELLKNEELYAKFSKCEFWIPKIAKSMTKLTQKGVKFVWGDTEEAAFQLIKQKLCSSPILALPKGNEDFMVYYDASHKGLGSVLMVMLKVSPWKGVVCFGKRGKLNPRYVRVFKVLAKVGVIAYKLELPQEFSRVHNTFHVSNLKKCYADIPLAVPLDGLYFDD
uniref:Putative reverse transcriptase domain-containing protein n=1 Tax=Tanacetum cinerariifolium TaxID=118510 RepID=A0A6L2MTU1_TANCI|nr:putative reverse transcriptase domain-containing protein [Tanacetum cinerariifolium]